MKTENKIQHVRAARNNMQPQPQQPQQPQQQQHTTQHNKVRIITLSPTVGTTQFTSLANGLQNNIRIITVNHDGTYNLTSGRQHNAAEAISPNSANTAILELEPQYTLANGGIIISNPTAIQPECSLTGGRQNISPNSSTASNNEQYVLTKGGIITTVPATTNISPQFTLTSGHQNNAGIISTVPPTTNISPQYTLTSGHQNNAGIINTVPPTTNISAQYTLTSGHQNNPAGIISTVRPPTTLIQYPPTNSSNSPAIQQQRSNFVEVKINPTDKPEFINLTSDCHFWEQLRRYEKFCESYNVPIHQMASSLVRAIGMQNKGKFNVIVYNFLLAIPESPPIVNGVREALKTDSFCSMICYNNEVFGVAMFPSSHHVTYYFPEFSSYTPQVQRLVYAYGNKTLRYCIEKKALAFDFRPVRVVTSAQTQAMLLNARLQQAIQQRQRQQQQAQNGAPSPSLGLSNAQVQHRAPNGAEMRIQQQQQQQQQQNHQQRQHPEFIQLE